MNPFIRAQIEMYRDRIEKCRDSIATLRREGLNRLIPRIGSETEHPLRRSIAGCLVKAESAAVVSKAVAERRFLSDSELTELEELVEERVGKEGARIRRETARLLREYAISFIEAARKQVRAGRSFMYAADPSPQGLNTSRPPRIKQPSSPKLQTRAGRGSDRCDRGAVGRAASRAGELAHEALHRERGDQARARGPCARCKRRGNSSNFVINPNRRWDVRPTESVVWPRDTDDYGDE
jgi:hypothetical protein